MSDLDRLREENERLKWDLDNFTDEAAGEAKARSKLRQRVAELEHDVSMRQRDNDELSAYIKRRDKEWEERGERMADMYEFLRARQLHESFEDWFNDSTGEPL